MGLDELRKKVNGIDSKIIRFLNERAKLSLAIGQDKIKNNESIYAPHRETEILKRLEALNKGPMTKEAIRAIYREIMSSSIALEKPLSIAHLGTQGSHTHIAAQKKFGSQVNYVSCGSMQDVFQKVECGECDYGVVPIENSTEGAVTHTLDLLIDSDLKVCSQMYMRISHYLMSKASMKNIKKIYSNPQVFGQCRNWLRHHLPQVEQILVASTVEAAKMAAREKNAAAIASKEAAAIHKLKVLAANIQDMAHNTTRFFIISVQDAAPSGCDRTSILFSIKDKVGALYAMLKPFYRYKINLTKIESRPSKRKAWDYYFFVDFEGHRLDKNVKKALSELENMCQYLKILGSYPVL